mmetsp:Transcript_21559/g.44974  ORF Transcript_21559/g.44974 Transcript_21559/m.44974 type:complete len:607 (-) Transcript_21559:19-1839(-)
MASNTKAIVKSVDGDEIEIQTLWNERKILLIFLRQLGCRWCRFQVSEIMQAGLTARLKSKGIQLVCISLGTPEQAKRWLEITNFDGELYVDDRTVGDPRLGVEKSQSVSYGVFRLKRGADVLRLDDAEASKLAAKTALKYPDLEELAEKDGTMTIWPGDVFQTGGAFVLGPGNTCDFAYRSKYAGDHPSVSDLMKYSLGVEKVSGKEVEIVYDSTAAWLKWMKMEGKVMVGWGGRIVNDNAVQRAILGVATVWKKYGVMLGVGCAGGLLGWKSAQGQKRGGGGYATLRYSLSYALGSLTAFSILKEVYLAATKKSIKYLKTSDITLLTPVDIDRKVLENGMPECDCGETMAAMPMLGLREPADVPEGKKLSRQRSETWSSGPELESSNEFQTILCYVREFLAKPHPSVGRGGPVCPFVPTSLKKNSIYMSVIRTSSLVDGEALGQDKEDIVRKILVKLLQDFVPVFLGLEPSKGRLRQFKAVILVFPDVKSSQAHDIIDAVQVLAKPFFVEKGLMVGEFHETNNASGLRNPNFFPLRTPYPCLAIRHMVPGDFVFMTLDDYGLEMRAKLLRGFLDVFGDDDKPQVGMAREKLRETEEALLHAKAEQ